MTFTAEILVNITGGELVGNPDQTFDTIVVDSRRPLLTGEALFVAISGKNHDGHIYIRHMIDRGCKSFLVERIPDDASGFDCTFVITGNALLALQKLAGYKRQLFAGVVFGVTGSNGKTIVKEWLSEILGTRFGVIRSPRSYNSQTGVPLSAWHLDERYDVAILEAGISLPEEMARLEDIIKPDIGVITNIGDAHGENFISKEIKAREKLSLFKNAATIVFPVDDPLLRDLVNALYSPSSIKMITWSLTGIEASIMGEIESRGSQGTEMIIIRGDERCEMAFPFSDRASIENCMSVIAAATAVGMELPNIAAAITGLLPIAMRMELKKGKNGTQIIGDYYNSDPVSLRVGIEYLENKRDNGATIILSDFVQCGGDNDQIYGEVASLVNSSGVTRFVGIGKNLISKQSLFKPDSYFYESTAQFLAEFPQAVLKDEIILLKGARSFGFERIGRALEYQSHQTLLEINLDALSHNLTFIRNRLNPGTKLMAMVKAFAYGSGASEIAAHMEFSRIDYLAVAYADEGVALRESGITLPIMVMSPEQSSFETLIRYDLEPEIYSLPVLNAFLETASRFGLSEFPVHIKLDTGMHRLGFMPHESELLAAILGSTDIIKVVSIFTHLAASENSSLDNFSVKQANRFTEMADSIEENLGYRPIRHILNSSGIFRFPEYQFDMVRAGIGMYGVGVESESQLLPVARFVSRVSQVKTIPQGEPIGYGCRSVSDDVREIAIVPVGYADGLDIRLSEGKGELLVNNTPAPIVGRVCMDMCMLDVTGMGVSEGDSVEIFGENLTVEKLAEMSGTIPYDVITGISPRVKRIYLKE